MSRGAWLLVLVAGVAAGCTTALYAGPRRPASEVAIVGSRWNVHIRHVDGTWIRGGGPAGTRSKYELLPGRHAVGLSVEVREVSGPIAQVRYAPPITLCLDAQPGHTYLATAPDTVDAWEPRLIDEESHVPVGWRCEGR